MKISLQIALLSVVFLTFCSRVENDVLEARIDFQNERCFLITNVQNYILDHAARHTLYLLCNDGENLNDYISVYIISAPSRSGFNIVVERDINETDVISIVYCKRYFRSISEDEINERVNNFINAFQKPPYFAIALVQDDESCANEAHQICERLGDVASQLPSCQRSLIDQ